MISENIAAAISNYKKKKQHAPEQKTLTKIKCNNCGYDWPHVQRYPAQDKVCNNCKMVGHFEQVCRSSKEKASKSISTVIISAIQKVSGLSESDHCELPKLDILVGKNDNELPIKTEVVADTGAQVTVACEFHMKHLGIKEKQLNKSYESSKHVGGEALKYLEVTQFMLYTMKNVLKQKYILLKV